MRYVGIAFVLLSAAASPAAALPPVSTPLTALTVSATTGEKPQSKVWFHDGRWWCVLPNATGTWVWRLDGAAWTSVLQLSGATGTHADVKAVGSVAHVLLFNGSSTALASIEYVPATQTWQPWTTRPTPAPIALDGGTETATIDLDSQGRMWLATDRAAGTDQVVVYYSDSPYGSWSGPVTLATGITSDDIAVVTAFPDGKIGVLWSNQDTRLFGFRTHADGADPATWSADETPASQSALGVGLGMADDHMHVAVASDATLYAAVKTSYDTAGYPKIAMLVRRPGGAWDGLYEVDQAGTRAIALLDEGAGTITIVYTSVEGAGNIIYKESPTSSIAFGPATVLMNGGLNDATSVKANVSGAVAILAGNGSSLSGVLRSGAAYTITASAGLGGTISPAGAIGVAAGGSQGFTISPNSGFAIADVMVDDVSVGAVPVYTFSGVSANHTIAASFTPTSPVGDLVGWWRMENDLTDASTYGNHAGAVGVPTYGAGVSGQALSLSGSGQYASVADNASLDITNQITMAAWFKCTKTGFATQRLLQKGVMASSNGYELSLSSPGKVFVRLNQSSSADTFRINSTTSYPVNGSAWMHGAATFDGTTMRLYVNGVLEGTLVPNRVIAIGTNNTALTIGAMSNNTNLFQGALDDVRLYNRALSAGEIAALAGLTTYTITSTAGPNGTISPNGAVVVGQGASQTFTITPAVGFGVADVVVDGGSVGAVTTYTFANVQAPHTILASFTGAGHIITASSGPGGTISPNGAVAVADGGSQSFTITPSPCFDITSVLVDGSPVGPVTSYDFTNVTSDRTIAASFVQRSYTITASAGGNGAISPSGAVAVLCGTNQAFTITPDPGYRVLDVTVDGGSVGAVTGHTITNVQAAHAISATFVFDDPAGYLVGHWPMNEGSGSQVLDATANGLHGALTGVPGWVSGMEGLALQLNGTSQYALVPDDNRLDLASAITMAAWIKPAKLGTANVIAKASFVAPLVPGYELNLSSGGKPFVRFNASDTYRVNGATSYPTDGSTWMHVAATYDGSAIRLYVNGVEDGSLASVFGISTNTGALGIGAQNDGNTGRLFQGALDDVRLYSRALSASEVRALASHPLAITSVHGSVTKSPDQPTYLHNAVVSLTAVPDPGYQFTGWSGAATGTSNPVNVTMDAGKSVTASFESAAEATVNAVSPGGVVSSANPTVSVPVRISRTAATPILGFSVDVALSPELTTTTGAFAVGPFLTTLNPDVSFQVVDNGGGRYTVDGVTLGPPCGAAALDEVLFTIGVGSGAPSGTGTVTIEAAHFRDCSNDSLITATGTVASVAIDRTGPSVTVTAPDGGEFWLAGSVHDIAWSATDAAGIAANGVDLAYSTDGIAWTPIATGIANSSPYAWTVPNVISATARVRVTTRDTHGNATADASNAVFAITVTPITTLTASPVRSGNDADGTIPVRLHWDDVLPVGSTVQVYRARFGGYPEYDDGSGMAPGLPGWEPTSPWELTSVTASDQTDEVNNVVGADGRDTWYYVAFVRDPLGTASPPSNLTVGRPNYLLGDVSDGTALGGGNNVVDGADISALGDAYGATGSAVAAVAYLDVGPTQDYSLATRPQTDNALNFEDLVMFALNFDITAISPLANAPQPAKPAAGRGATVAASRASADRLTLESPERVTAGEEFVVRIRLEGSGRVQALSAALGWQAGVVEPVAVSAGEWLARLGGVAFSPRAGVADVALLGARGGGLAGEGVVAEVRFRALAAGEPRVALTSLKARDPANHEVEVATSIAQLEAPRPTTTELSAVYPNPFQGAATIAFSLVDRGPATVSVFGVDGRAVRTLASGELEGGAYRLAWDGRDDGGQLVPAGVYFVRLTTTGARSTRRVAFLR